MAKVKIWFEGLNERKQDDLRGQIREQVSAIWFAKKEKADPELDLNNYMLTDQDDKELDALVEDYIFENDIGVEYTI